MGKWAKQLAWRARIAESKWHQKLKEKALRSEWHRCNEDLKYFWAKFYLAKDAETKLNLLKIMAGERYGSGKLGKQRTARLRERFKESKGRYFRVNAKPCEVCGAYATARHHIVQLQNGGGNHHQNLIRLCADCHAAIHPWLVGRVG